MTTRRRSESKAIWANGSPSIRIEPAVGSISLVSNFAIVVLPEPVWPTIATRVRGSIRSVTSRSTLSPPG